MVVVGASNDFRYLCAGAGAGIARDGLSNHTECLACSLVTLRSILKRDAEGPHLFNTEQNRIPILVTIHRWRSIGKQSGSPVNPGGLTVGKCEPCVAGYTRTSSGEDMVQLP